MSKHAFYSAKAAREFGGAVNWSGPNGVVSCTLVTDDPEAKNYNWPDVEYRGEVHKFLGVHLWPQQ